ncbi:MAG TPA: limonene-1,2-epoxide hydrolase family protein [Xanthobacteraceae bacterium]|nr:limonene-1,2-epoxide hydrolase family protein [Xanthobacteraceae bacterium]
MPKSPEDLVRDFCALWEARDIEGIVGACTEDVRYQNVPVPEMIGRDAMRKFISRNLTACDAMEFKLLAIAMTADGRSVLTERMDAFHFGDKRVPIPIMGIFVFRGDKISEWRDYTDMRAFIEHMRAIGQRPGPGIVQE